MIMLMNVTEVLPMISTWIAVKMPVIARFLIVHIQVGIYVRIVINTP